MRISGETKPFAVLGHPIKHSLSPVMHNAAFAALGMDAVYLAFDVKPERLMDVLQAMADMGFCGVNITVPLKEVAFLGLKHLDKSAKWLGAVNTVEFTAHGMRGHNTDAPGFLKAVEEAFALNVKGHSVFVLGSGGAGRAVAITCAEAGARVVTVSDKDAERAARLGREIEALGAKADVHVAAPDTAAWVRVSRESDLVVQATPIGMHAGEESLLGSDAFRAGQVVFDMIYMYPETVFMQAARGGGARVANGLGMLLHQGALAFRIWTGREPAIVAMRQALEAAVYGQRKESAR